MRPVFLFLVIFSSSCGCTTSLFESRFVNVRRFAIEQRVITQFSDAVREDNEAALRNCISTRFEQKALRSSTAFRDLEILSLPKGKLTVVESDETSNGRREVVVSEEDTDERFQFQIVRDSSKRRWVVDDVVFRQQKKGARGTKSATEVMDLLLTLREFLDTWKGGERAEMLAVVATDLRSSLETLPEPWLKQMIGRVAAEYETAMARRPEAQLNETDAVVKLPGRNGFLLVRMTREDDSWLVSDVEVHNRKLEDHPGSIRRQSEAIGTATRFLKSYNGQDHATLKATSADSFYEEALQFADLSMLKLPAADYAPDDYELRAYAGHLTVMIPDRSRMVRMDLIDPEKQHTGLEIDTTPVPVTADKFAFVVREVSVYDRQTMQQTNLSSAFSAPARAMLFMSALEDRDMPMLRQLSTQAFSRGTWDRFTPETFTAVSTAECPRGDLVLQGSRVRGRKTELDFKAASGQLLSVILVEENDSLKIEDVQFPNRSAEVVSLKSQLELAVPLLELASAWQMKDIELVRKSCSMEFNRLVWSNVEALPEEFAGLPKMLASPVRRLKVNEKRATVAMQPDEGTLVNVWLLLENGAWVVDEVAMHHSDGQVVQIRSALRKEIAQQLLQNPSGVIQPVSYLNHDAPTDSSGSGVIRAHATSQSPLKGNLTMPARGKRSPASPGLPSAGQAAAVSGDGMMRFGPDREQTKQVDSIPAASLGNGSVYSVLPALADIPEQDNGVVYVEPVRHPGNAELSRTRTVTPDESSEHEEAPAARPPRRISDPSSHPIEIPLN